MSGVMNIISASSQQITCPNYVIAGNTTLNGSVAIGGPVTSLNNQSYAAEDDGLYQMNIGAGTFGSVPVSSTVVPFPGVTEGSLYFNGTAGNYLSFANTAISNYGWGTTTTPMTVEAWVYYNSFSGNGGAGSSLVGILNSYDGGNYWSFGPTSTGILKLYYNGTSVTPISTTSTISLNTWTHIAMTADTSLNIRIFINGVVAAGPTPLSGTLLVASAITALTIGQYNNGPTNAYISNLRIVTGAALYTAAFTPSTAPLTVANAGTTVFLLRVPQNPGKMLVSKIGGTTDVRAYPPVALTGASTDLTGKTSYGGGVYVASASSATAESYKAFDKRITTPNYFQISSSSYTANAAYSGTYTTADSSNNGYAGEWLQIQLPTSIIVSSYSNTGMFDLSNMATKWYLLGSRDGTKWDLLDQRTGITSWVAGVAQTFSVSTSQAYSFYRFVINICNGNQPAVQEMVFYGTQESINITSDGKVGIGVVNPIQALEVAGTALFSSIAVSSFVGLITVIDSGASYPSNDVGASNRPYISIKNSYATGAEVRIWGDVNNIGPQIDYRATLHRFLNPAGTTTFVSINGSGNVGIGTGTPATKLDVAGAIAISGTTVIDASRNISVSNGTFSGVLNNVNYKSYYPTIAGVLNAYTDLCSIYVTAVTAAIKITLMMAPGSGSLCKMYNITSYYTGESKWNRCLANTCTPSFNGNDYDIFLYFNNAGYISIRLYCVNTTVQSATSMRVNIEYHSTANGVLNDLTTSGVDANWQTYPIHHSTVLTQKSGAIAVNGTTVIDANRSVIVNNLTANGDVYMPAGLSRMSIGPNVPQDGRLTIQDYSNTVISFYYGAVKQGSITTNNGNGTVSYNTTSDYRLKENVQPLTNAISRLKRLPVYQFSFKTDVNKNIMDGFFAHEVHEVVPTAVFGEKDAVDDSGAIVAQALDYSKIVPLLTASLQEALVRIEKLEAKLEALINNNS